jgi:hypothetical protein
MSQGGDTSGIALYAALDSDLTLPTVDLTGAEFTIPGGSTSEMYTEVTRLAASAITSGTVGGAGVFDTIMTGFAAHLRAEYDANRITGAEYTKAFVALTQGAMTSAVQFLLARETTYWQGVQAQVGAITAKVENESAKLKNAVLKVQGMGEIANLGLTKLKMATEDLNFGIATYTLGTMLPLQSAGLTLDNVGKTTNNSIAAYNLATLLPQQAAKLTADIAVQNAQSANLTYTLTYLLPKQVTLVAEQGEVQRAQTLNTRSDAATVAGLTGKQKDLYTQQITSYQRDIEIKAAKIFSDAWITMKTLDEGLAAPTGFGNTSLDEVLTTIKTNVPL